MRGRLSPREEPCGGKDQGAGADARDRLFRAKVQEPREELPVLHDLRPSGASGNDDEIEVGEVPKHFMREEFHAEGARDFFFHGAEADRQVELRVELLCLREDFIDPDRVEFLYAVVEEDADPHEERRERREA